MKKRLIFADGTLSFRREGEYNFVPELPEWGGEKVITATIVLGIKAELRRELDNVLEKGDRVVMEFDSQQSGLDRGRVSVVAVNDSESLDKAELTVQIHHDDLKDVSLR